MLSKYQAAIDERNHDSVLLTRWYAGEVFQIFRDGNWPSEFRVRILNADGDVQFIDGQTLPTLSQARDRAFKILDLGLWRI